MADAFQELECNAKANGVSTEVFLAELLRMWAWMAQETQKGLILTSVEPPAEGAVRVVVQLKEKMMDMMQKRSGIESQREIVARALDFLEWLLEQRCQNRSIIAVDNEQMKDLGNNTTAILPFFIRPN